MTRTHVISPWPPIAGRFADGLQGEIRVPADKSISHRAVILGSLAKGNSRIDHLLQSEDAKRTLQIFRSLGIAMRQEKSTLVISGRGQNGLRACKAVLDCGNSGTTMRLLLGVLAAQGFDSRLTGDASLNRRPMGRVIEPLRQMGAHIEEEHSRTGRIIHVSGGRLHGISYESPIASAQVKSALLLAGLYAEGKTSIREPYLSRNHTERFLLSMGAKLSIGDCSVTLDPEGSVLAPFTVTVPGDPSSAAFLVVAALLVPKSSLLIRDVCLNPTRIAFLDVLKRMGAYLHYTVETEMAGEPVGTIAVKASPLWATDIDSHEIPWLVDEIPILAVAAARAKGETRIRGAAELRVKESDRIQTIGDLLTTLGVSFTPHSDGIDIRGASEWQGGAVSTAGDHRIAMAAAIAALLCRDELRIDDTDCIQTSFPNFFATLTGLGVKIDGA